MGAGIITQAMWIGSVALVGGLAGLRRGWRWQAADAAGCLIALTVAWWQHPRLASCVRALWKGPAVAQVTLIYLFAVLYGLWRLLISLCAPNSNRSRDKRWASGLIGAAQAGALATLAVTTLPYV